MLLLLLHAFLQLSSGKSTNQHTKKRSFQACSITKYNATIEPEWLWCFLYNCMECVFGGAMIKMSPNPAIHVCFGGWACIRSLVQAEVRFANLLWFLDVRRHAIIFESMILSLNSCWFCSLGEGKLLPVARHAGWSCRFWTLLVRTLIWNWLFQLGGCGCHYPAELKVVGAWSSPRFRFFMWSWYGRLRLLEIFHISTWAAARFLTRLLYRLSPCCHFAVDLHVVITIISDYIFPECSFLLTSE